MHNFTRIRTHLDTFRTIDRRLATDRTVRWVVLASGVLLSTVCYALVVFTAA
jgi:hypothetical protein